MWFVDQIKAFVKVRHDQLIEILVRRRIDLRNVRIISNLYYGQRESIWIGGHDTGEYRDHRGVRYGYILSPVLFNLYLEDILNKALNDPEMGIKINGLSINSLRYSNDTVLIAGTQEVLQMLLDGHSK